MLWECCLIPSWCKVTFSFWKLDLMAWFLIQKFDESICNFWMIYLRLENI